MRGRFSDGRVALVHEVAIRAGEASLNITAQDGTVLARWPLNEITADGPIFQCDATPQATLTVERPDDLLRLLPNKAGPRRLNWRLVALLAAAPALLVILWVAIPPMARLATRFVSMDTEIKLGDSLHAQILTAWPACTAMDGGAALWLLGTRVSGGHDVRPRRVMVVDSPMVNAITLPGGNVLVMRGLLDKLESPEQLAGVLAHEIGHVRRRDPLAASMRAIGIGFLATIVVGDASGMSGTAAATLLGFNYSRDDETQADRLALDLLRKADIDPAGMARTFAMLESETGDWPAFLSSHPPSAERAAAFLAGREPGRTYRPALSPDQWRALKGICGHQR